MSSLNLPPAPPAFRGFREDVPVSNCSRNLPHWRQEGATYFITFRLADSIPQAELKMLLRLRDRLSKGERQTWESREVVERTVFKDVEKHLDLGYGRCQLAEQQHALIVLNAFRFREGDRWEVGAVTVMPNHVHAIVRPISETLDAALKSVKQFSGREINRRLGERGQLWQHESYDRIVRDDEHLWRCLQYIGRNGRVAGVDALRWVCPHWAELGWRFVDQCHER